MSPSATVGETLKLSLGVIGLYTDPLFGLYYRRSRWLTHLHPPFPVFSNCSTCT